MRSNPCRRWKNDPDLPPDEQCATCGHTEQEHRDYEDDTVDARRDDWNERRMLDAEDRDLDGLDTDGDH